MTLSQYNQIYDKQAPLRTHFFNMNGLKRWFQGTGFKCLKCKNIVSIVYVVCMSMKNDVQMT